MALNAKTELPLTVAADGTAQIRARPYRAEVVRDGDEIFVWTAGGPGGHLLDARGTVMAARIDDCPNPAGSGTHRELVLDIRILDAAPRRALSFDRIAADRDSDGAPPRAAAGPRKHPLNKIATMESDVADLVRSHFEEH